jgi:bifunctional UDP-N-acetylglucosamine pyrophosphorylase / glucosamine-1-phosphate N-acetyltransferase
MESGELAVAILAAGIGTRMRTALPKVMHGIGGRPMVAHVAAVAAQLGAVRVALVVGPGMDDVAAAARAAAPGLKIDVAIQAQRLGTGHAVAATRPVLSGFGGDVLVLYGDVPLIRPDTLARLVAGRRAGGHAIAVLGMRPKDPAEYGRLVVGERDRLDRIVELRDANAAERAIGLCNSGVMAIDGTILFDLIGKLTPANAQGEFYLTDLIALAQQSGRSCGYAEGPAAELLGVNSRAELAAAEAVFQDRMRRAALDGGATLVDPGSVWFSHDTVVGSDVIIHPCVTFGAGVVVGDRAVIGPFNHLAGITVPHGATIGAGSRI